ncbi:hypothetical protein ACWG43_30645, partial [Streptomyces albidoflavus]
SFEAHRRRQHAGRCAGAACRLPSGTAGHARTGCRWRAGPEHADGWPNRQQHGIRRWFSRARSGRTARLRDPGRAHSRPATTGHARPAGHGQEPGHGVGPGRRGAGGRLTDGRHVLEPARVSGEVRHSRAAGRAVRLRALVSARTSRRACRALRARPGEQARHHARLSLAGRLGLLVLRPVVLYRPEPTGAGNDLRPYRR